MLQLLSYTQYININIVILSIPTFGVDTDPVKVTGKFFRNVSFPSRRQSNHGNNVRCINIVKTFT